MSDLDALKAQLEETKPDSEDAVRARFTLKTRIADAEYVVEMDDLHAPKPEPKPEPAPKEPVVEPKKPRKGSK